MAMLVKDPGARIDYEFDWADACAVGQVLTDSAWAVAPDEADGVTIAGSANDLLSTVVTLAGGIAGHVYRVTNRVTMSAGQIEERSMTVRVEER